VASCHQTKKIIKKLSALVYKFFAHTQHAQKQNFLLKECQTNAQTTIFKIEKKILTFSLVGGLYVLVDCIVIVILSQPRQMCAEKVNKVEVIPRDWRIGAKKE